jgi:glutamate/tyrosine decarboxylase-like PLP-dependent enzyme
MEMLAPAAACNPVLALFPPSDERSRIEFQLTGRLLEAEARVRAGAVVPTVDHAAFERELAAFDFSSPRLLGDLIEWTIARLEAGVVHVNHPRYFGLFNPAPSFPAQCADRILGSFNPQLASFATSPVPVAVEAHVIRHIADRIGLPAGSGGHFTNAGSEANFTAVVCALTRAEPAYADQGLRAFRGWPVFYVSRDSHLPWLKIAHQVGLGRDSVRLVRTDGDGRMDAAELAAIIADDRDAGHIPIMVAATAGTTIAGMIDPLNACAEIARQHELWYHVDAAWGGALIASERYRTLLAGAELADSVTIDAHKWFATTMGCGMFITSRPDILPAAFGITTSFMPVAAPTRAPYTQTGQWSRRFTGLRLFLSLVAAGWAGFAAHVERAIELTHQLEGRLVAQSWTVANRSDMAVSCLIPPPGAQDVGKIVSRILRSGVAWISKTCHEGREVVRVCLTNGETTAEDISALVAALADAARRAD